MGRGVEEKKYILILRDDHSGYVWLWPTEAADSAEAASALSNWIGCIRLYEMAVQ